MLYFFFFSGTSDYRKALNLDAWVYCYATECCKAPDLYPELFSNAAEAIMHRQMHMAKHDITTANAKHVYLHLMREFIGN